MLDLGRDARACAAHASEDAVTPHKCPVCLGTGLLNRPPWLAGDQHEWSDGNTGPYECKACKGTGIIWEKTP